jgi:hypothetical protein
MPSVSVFTQNQQVVFIDGLGQSWAGVVHKVNGDGSYNVTVFTDGGPQVYLSMTPSGGVGQANNGCSFQAIP